MLKMIKGLSRLACLACMMMLAGCKVSDDSPTAERANDMTIQITSSAFNESEIIPRFYTCDAQNVSPPLAWADVPSSTVSLAIIMDDPDAPAGTWVHWVLFNLPPELTSLDQGTTGKGTDGTNDFRKLGYGGPCPPRGSSHRYFIKLYALDARLDIKEGATKAQVESAMKGHILAQGQLIGKYNR